MDSDLDSLSRKSAECRICHEEDDAKSMEAPCSCRGSLKYAHRKCIERWCDEKGDTLCEICHQQFEPGYATSPPAFLCCGSPMDVRANWSTPVRDLHNPRLVAMVTTMDQEFLGSDSDEYSDLSTSSLICCRVVAIIFTLLLVLRYTLAITTSGAEAGILSFLGL